MRDGGRMRREYRQIIARVEGKLPRYRKLFRGLGRKGQREVERCFRAAHERAFAEINCLQCGNCCLTTGPRLSERDVQRLAGALSLRPARFIQRYTRRDEDGDLVFARMPCPLLGEDLYCSVYSVRPTACREYPHTEEVATARQLTLVLKNVTICPIAAQTVEDAADCYGGVE
jgi:hypothetical protein